MKSAKYWEILLYQAGGEGDGLEGSEEIQMSYLNLKIQKGVID
jgi:hypothetical protein